MDTAEDYRDRAREPDRTGETDEPDERDQERERRELRWLIEAIRQEPLGV